MSIMNTHAGREWCRAATQDAIPIHDRPTPQQIIDAEQPGALDGCGNLSRHLDFALRRRDQQLDQLTVADSFRHPDARTLRPGWAGETFDLHACVQALFTIKLPNPWTLINKPRRPLASTSPSARGRRCIVAMPGELGTNADVLHFQPRDG
jgi:hypothetical protein